ncbi:hypothetical protein BPTFM16_01161 [Altererythrobacter insulae]|nr:hypothetical protein BPTFM16_01161 [Altererythrobacter insulae]
MGIVSRTAAPVEPETDEWVNEGGSLKPVTATQLPEGIIAVTSTHYEVGPYSYSRLEDAQAEFGRQSGTQGICPDSN